jgi:hypothetical protein
MRILGRNAPENEVAGPRSVHGTAGLEKMWSLCNEDSGKTMKPLIRITAVGNEWIVHPRILKEGGLGS